MQIGAVYYEHKINVFVWLIIQDQYSAEYKCTPNSVLIDKICKFSSVCAPRNYDFEPSI